MSGRFLTGILYGVVGFGLLATLVMMTLERQREFAVMLATGLSRRRLQAMLALESLALAALGVIMGLLLITPILVYFWANPITLSGETAQLIQEMGYDPIIPFSLAPALFIEQVEAVLMIVALCITYPQIIARRLCITTALRGG